MIGHVKLVVLFIVGVAHFSTAMKCVGCPQQVDRNDPEVHDTLTSTLLNLESLPKGTENEHTTLEEINKVTVQVVNGLKYTYEFEARGVKTHKLYKCKLVVYTQPWVILKKVNEYNCQEIANRNKRSLDGGEVEVDLNENSLPELRNFISQELTKKQESKRLMGVVKVFKASRQVVAGLMTRATVEVAPIECPVDGSHSQNCPFVKEGHKLCKVAVWEKPWLQKKELVSFECSDVPEYCSGCPHEENPSDVVANQCLERSIFNINFKSQSNKHWKLTKINKVQKQVVAGLKYSFTFEAEDENKESHLCNAVVISQPWISDEPTVEKFECSPKA